MSQLTGATVLITGGASGIGKIMGKLFLEEGARRLLIWDKDRVQAEAFSSALRSGGYEVHVYPADLRRVDEIISAADSIQQQFGGIDVLVNNAGVITGKEFRHHSHGEIDDTMGVNAGGFMHVALAFIPGMIEKKKGHIVNIASAAGLLASPKMSVYVASKHAVVGWSESLRIELEAISKDLRVTTVTPSFIHTGMFEGARSPVIPFLDPETTAKKIIAGIKKNKIIIRMPRIVYAVPFARGILPIRWLNVVVGNWFGFHHSMDNFTGRKK